MGYGISGIIGTSFIINLLTAGSLNLLWGLFHSLEMVAIHFVMSLRLPMNASVMYKVIYDISDFSVLPTD